MNFAVISNSSRSIDVVVSIAVISSLNIIKSHLDYKYFRFWYFLTNGIYPYFKSHILPWLWWELGYDAGDGILMRRINSMPCYAGECNCQFPSMIIPKWVLIPFVYTAGKSFNFSIPTLHSWKCYWGKSRLKLVYTSQVKHRKNCADGFRFPALLWVEPTDIS